MKSVPLRYVVLLVIAVGGTVFAIASRATPSGDNSANTGKDLQVADGLIDLEGVKVVPVALETGRLLPAWVNATANEPVVALVDEKNNGNESYDEWVGRSGIKPKVVAPLADLNPSIPQEYGQWRLVDLIEAGDRQLLLYGDSIEGSLETRFLFAVENATGQVRYGLDFRPENDQYPSPVIWASEYEGSLYLQRGGSSIAAIRPETGEIIWRTDGGPILRALHRGYLFGVSDGLVVMHAGTGETLQTQSLGPVEELPTTTLAELGVKDEQIFVRTEVSNYVFRLRPEGSPNPTPTPTPTPNCAGSWPCPKPSLTPSPDAPAQTPRSANATPAEVKVAPPPPAPPRSIPPDAVFYEPSPVPSTRCAKPFGDGPTNLRVINHSTTKSVEVYWINFDCNEQLFKVVGPDQWYQVDSFVGHVWRFRSAVTGQQIGEFPAKRTDPTIVNCLDVCGSAP